MHEEDTAVIEHVMIERSGSTLSDQLPAIYLVGPMGAGKTTIGKLLAKALGRKFIDCDWYIIESTGADIPWIFEKEGEVGFRDRETRAIDELTRLPNIIMATGGGAVVRPENREMLSRGLVIYLDANVDVQLARTRKDKNRPLLQTENPRAVLEELYRVRNPLYREVADIIIPTGRLYPKQMMHELLDALKKHANTDTD